MSHTAIIKTKMELAQQQVMAVLNWNELDYGNYQEAQGYNYLYSWLGNDNPMVKEHAHSAHFWAWWKNHWFKRDQTFLNRYTPLEDRDDQLAFYDHIHDAEGIEYIPHEVVLKASAKAFVPFVDARTAKLRELDAAIREVERIELEIQQLERVRR